MSKSRLSEDQKFNRLLRKISAKERDTARARNRRTKRLIQSYIANAR